MQEEEFYVITWDAKKETIFEMPTGGAALMRSGKNLLKLARKEQCLALLCAATPCFRLRHSCAAHIDAGMHPLYAGMSFTKTIKITAPVAGVVHNASLTATCPPVQPSEPEAQQHTLFGVANMCRARLGITRQSCFRFWFAC